MYAQEDINMADELEMLFYPCNPELMRLFSLCIFVLYFHTRQVVAIRFVKSGSYAKIFSETLIQK